MYKYSIERPLKLFQVIYQPTKHLSSQPFLFQKLHTQKQSHLASGITNPLPPSPCSLFFDHFSVFVLLSVYWYRVHFYRIKPAVYR